MHAKAILQSSSQMEEFAHSESYFASQPRHLPLVSIGSPLDQWPGSYILPGMTLRGNLAVVYDALESSSPATSQLVS